MCKGDGAPRRHQHQRHDQNRLQQSHPDLDGRTAARAQDRHEEHQRDDHQILEDQYAQRDLAGRRVGNTTIGQQLHDDGRVRGYSGVIADENRVARGVLIERPNEKFPGRAKFHVFAQRV